MDKSITLQAPAKLNLHLDIFSKQDDGFHELQTIFVMIDLYDRLEVHFTEKPGCRVTGFQGVASRDNLIYRAYQLYAQKTGVRFGCEVACEKKIPQKAGLGGGSSDCAAMLRALNMKNRTENGEELDSSGLLSIASQLGSDVPFFLIGPAAYAEGRGEKLEKIEMEHQYPVILVKPEIDISTRDAFTWFDDVSWVSRQHQSKEMILRNLLQNGPEKWPFFNSFTPILIRRFPHLGDLMGRLKEAGAAYANMSGSGSALFGVFTDEKSAKIARKTLKKVAKNVWKLKMLASPPEAVYNEARLE